MVSLRLQTAKPKTVDSQTIREWLIFTDAAYDKETKQGGLGTELVNSSGDCVAWFSLPLDRHACCVFGAHGTETIIYELELLAACLAIDVWNHHLRGSYSVHYGNNDSVRFALIRGTGLGTVTATIMNLHLQTEIENNTSLWFARIPTEANLAVIPSRLSDHPFLRAELNESTVAAAGLERFLGEVANARSLMKEKGERHQTSPRVKKIVR